MIIAPTLTTPLPSARPQAAQLPPREVSPAPQAKDGGPATQPSDDQTGKTGSTGTNTEPSDAAAAKRLNKLKAIFGELDLHNISGSEASKLATDLYKAGEITRDQKNIMQITALANSVFDEPTDLTKALNAISDRKDLPGFEKADDLATLLLDLYEEVNPPQKTEPSDDVSGDDTPGNDADPGATGNGEPASDPSAEFSPRLDIRI